MKFLDDNFLLETKTAQKLFHDYASDMPIYDYHCHIIPGEILENRSYENITQIWLNGDHYKWRLMRANGLDESLISGGAPDYDRFLAFAGTLQQAVGSPVYIWSHLELKRFFGVDEPLTPESAPRIWEKTGEILRGGMRCRDLINKFKVRVVCTTDDPADDLAVHDRLKNEDLGFRVAPAFRPDKYVEITKPGFAEAIKRLESCIGRELDSFEAVCAALDERAGYFHDRGCRLSDEGIDYIPFLEAGSVAELDAIFKKARSGGAVTAEEGDKYKTELLTALFSGYAGRGWAAQLHIGALRNNNSDGFKKMGPDTGYDSIDDPRIAQTLSRFMDRLNTSGRLPKTILYSANGNDNMVLAAMAGNFQSKPAGKIQFGAAWWFNDHFDGMTDQLKALANVGLLGRFVGMLTDSRSFLSYTRHEYFRRVLCNFIGHIVERGEYPEDWDNLGRMVKAICFDNAENYFGI